MRCSCRFSDSARKGRKDGERLLLMAHLFCRARSSMQLCQTLPVQPWLVQGDAEDLPLPTDGFDRYVSAGSIEYWPEPQRGIREAYRVLKKGGTACLIGPVHPTFWLSRFFADVWMLFPTEAEYMEVRDPDS